MFIPIGVMDEIIEVVAFACDHCGGGYEWECREPGYLDNDFEEQPQMDNGHMQARRLLSVLTYYVKHQERP